MCLGDVIDQLHDEHGLSNASDTNESNLATTLVLRASTMDPSRGNLKLNAPETTTLLLSRARDHSELRTKDQLSRPQERARCYRPRSEGTEQAVIHLHLSVILSYPGAPLLGRCLCPTDAALEYATCGLLQRVPCLR